MFDPGSVVESELPDLVDNLGTFFSDRVKVILRDEGMRSDVAEALCANKIENVASFFKLAASFSLVIESQDGVNLVAGFKRGANILKAEEKKGPLPEGAVVDPALLALPAEQALHQALAAAAATVDAKLGTEDFDGAMQALASLRGPVDAFFEQVLVNDPDPAVRTNRLALLLAFRDTTREVADFGKLAG